jgi:hypothetical protein
MLSCELILSTASRDCKDLDKVFYDFMNRNMHGYWGLPDTSFQLHSPCGFSVGGKQSTLRRFEQSHCHCVMIMAIVPPITARRRGTSWALLEIDPTDGWG